MGGLAVGLTLGADPGLGELEKAAIMGSLAASFAIEQVGMPVLAHTTHGETWNKVRVADRLLDYRRRLGEYVQP